MLSQSTRSKSCLLPFFFERNNSQLSTSFSTTSSIYRPHQTVTSSTLLALFELSLNSSEILKLDIPVVKSTHPSFSPEIANGCLSSSSPTLDYLSSTKSTRSDIDSNTIEMNFVDKGKGKAVEQDMNEAGINLDWTERSISAGSGIVLSSSDHGSNSPYSSPLYSQAQYTAVQSTQHDSFRQPALLIHPQPKSSSSLPPSRSSSPLLRPTLSRFSSREAVPRSAGRAGESSRSCISDVEISLGSGGPIAPLPDRVHSRTPIRINVAITSSLLSPSSVISTSSTSPTRSNSPAPHHLLAHLDSNVTASAFSSIPPSISRSLAAPPSLERSSSEPGTSRHRSASTVGRTSTKLERFSDPTSHWLSEDEGGNMIRASITGPEMAERKARRQACRPGGLEHDHLDRNADASSKILNSTAIQHSIHHRPSSVFTTTPPSHSPSPSPAISDSIPPNLVNVLSEISNAIICPGCHKSLHDPTTLGCGHSICLACTVTPQAFIRPLIDFSEESQFARNPILPVPPLVTRSISSPLLSTGNVINDRRSISSLMRGRAKMTCPVKDCVHKERGVNTAGEAKVDFVLQKVLSLLRRDIPDFEIEVNLMLCDMDTEMEADDEEDLDHEGDSPTSNGSGGGIEEVEFSKRIHRSRDWQTTKRQKAGNVIPITQKVTTFDMDQVPSTFLSELQSELECQVCVQLYHDPITTPCGHTFCAKCLARSLDHSDKCALCRSDIPSFTFFQSQPINSTTNSIISIAFPSIQAERKASIEADEKSSSMDTPIFVCTLAWPNLPTYMHIFEPRYRLMMRRVMDGDRMFGMVLPSRNDGGVSEYGTMLHVQSCNMIEDGRSIVECIGSYRFRVLEKGTFDGYTVGRIERVDDISPEQEAELERIALARNVGPITPPRAPISLSSSSSTTPSGSPPAELPVELSTAQLMTVCLEFVQTLRSGSAPWVLQRLNNTIGPMPTNPSDFSFWMAEVMPVDDHVKAALLQITSPRERLRLLVFWIEQFRSSWWFSRGCSVM